LYLVNDMTQKHPIIPPPELVREWQMKIEYCSKRVDREAAVAKIFQLGADMELDACCEWLSVPCPSYGRELRNARRPNLLSLKERGLKALLECYRYIPEDLYDVITEAIESLPD
jgi:hypothetical protein